MDLEEAIKVVKNIDTTDIHCVNCVLSEKDKCIHDMFGYPCQRIAINIVLKELNRLKSLDINEQQEVIKKQERDCIVYRQKIKALKEYEEKLQKENKELKDDRDFYREQCLLKGGD